MESGNGRVLIAPGITVRLFAMDDAAAIADLFQASVRTLAAPDYTPSQLRAWAPNSIDAEKFGKRCRSKSTWLAEIEGRIAGFSDLEPDGHIDRLFCAPEAAGQGIASRLYDAIEAAARRQGITSLFTEASELARRLFEHKGFAVVKRQNLVVRGVAIHNYRMAKAMDLTTPHLTWPGGPECPELALHLSAQRDSSGKQSLFAPHSGYLRVSCHGHHGPLA